LDLRLATRGRRLAVTAHNLHAHNRPDEPFAFRNTRAAFRQANVVFAHSEPAKELLATTYGLERDRFAVIPHGDLSVVLEPPATIESARCELQLGAGKLCLMFGAVEPYKGLEEVIALWKNARPDCTLAIVGKPCSGEYGESIAEAAMNERIILRLGWMSDAQLRLWLSAANCVLFNYRTIFTSGAANLARAYGIPQLLPERLHTVVLGEPSPRVYRFRSLNDGFLPQLAAACKAGPDYAGAAAWRAETSWDRVAELTVAGYEKALR
jgi:hypothetical protein